ncbi:MAG: hypothetical protein BWX84_02174 [Verrucomicrobia bacterium ADurb.Bin118]|nr:MAG: hypothetical protein BWX84_02174 [Verrucomicrobia bacterium ADurb.Bin118]
MIAPKLDCSTRLLMVWYIVCNRNAGKPLVVSFSSDSNNAWVTLLRPTSLGRKGKRVMFVPQCSPRAVRICPIFRSTNAAASVSLMVKSPRLISRVNPA